MHWQGKAVLHSMTLPMTLVLSSIVRMHHMVPMVHMVHMVHMDHTDPMVHMVHMDHTVPMVPMVHTVHTVLTALGKIAGTGK